MNALDFFSILIPIAAFGALSFIALFYCIEYKWPTRGIACFGMILLSFYAVARFVKVDAVYSGRAECKLVDYADGTRGWKLVLKEAK